MKSVGVIAEYNPFHTGHAYHIENARKKSNADCVIAVMSGNFVQRGEPAFADKYTRCACALAGGVDLVVELPTIYATASAEQFAFGGISLLKALDVDAISFGAETSDMELLTKIATLLCHETADFKTVLSKALANGDSMPLARQKAVAHCLNMPNIAEVMAASNNILAIEYIKQLIKLDFNIEICGIKRIGNDYHGIDSTLIPSATLVRKTYFDDGITAIKEQLPASVYDILYHKNSFICTDDFSMLLNYSIKTDANISDYADVGEVIANKIENAYTKKDFYTFNELADAIKSKELTRTRIARALLHIILKQKPICDAPSYIRILGMNAKGQEYLSSIKKNAALPLVTNLADYSKKAATNPILNQEIVVTDIYNMILEQKYSVRLPNEFRQPLIRL